jgi:uncharacterized protein YbjT (DUF2867 family)
MIAVLGATGTIGRRVVAELSRKRGVIRALVRTVPANPIGSVDYVQIDLTKKESIELALDRVEKLFLLSPIGEAQSVSELNIVTSAAKQGVRRIVKLSVMHADPVSPIEFARIHGSLEEAIRASGCEWTFIRPNMFLQNLFWYKTALQQGQLPLPLADAPVSHVDANDVASVSATALLDDAHAEKSYTVTGPAAVTGTEMASVLSEVLHKAISYQPLSRASFQAYLQSTGETPYVVAAEVGLFSYWSEGHGSQVTGDVAQVTGRAATSLKTFAHRERANLL